MMMYRFRSINVYKVSKVLKLPIPGVLYKLYILKTDALPEFTDIGL